MEVAAESLLALKKRFGISQAEVRGVVAQTLDALADAYDGRGGRVGAAWSYASPACARMRWSMEARPLERCGVRASAMPISRMKCVVSLLLESGWMLMSVFCVQKNLIRLKKF